MPIPTEPIGSIPRPPELVAGMQQFATGRLSRDQFARLQDAAIRDTIRRFEATESPVITDGEQAKPSFATYPIHGLTNLAPDGVTIPFADGHVRQLPRLTAGPFRYQTYADGYVARARALAHVPVKQAVIAASALSLLYPQDGIRGYPREAFLSDLLREAETDIRRCLAQGAHVVQLDFTEGPPPGPGPAPPTGGPSVCGWWGFPRPGPPRTRERERGAQARTPLLPSAALCRCVVGHSRRSPCRVRWGGGEEPRRRLWAAAAPLAVPPLSRGAAPRASLGGSARLPFVFWGWGRGGGRPLREIEL